MDWNEEERNGEEWFFDLKYLTKIRNNNIIHFNEYKNI